MHISPGSVPGKAGDYHAVHQIRLLWWEAHVKNKGLCFCEAFNWPHILSLSSKCVGEDSRVLMRERFIPHWPVKTRIV